MKKKIIIFSSIGAALLISAIVLIICLCLPKNKSYRSIKVFDLNGNVTVTRNNSDITAQKDMKLKNEDTLTIKEESSAVLKLDNDKFIMAKENTKIKLEATGKANNTKTRLHVYDGGVVVEVKEKLKDKESFEIASSNSVMAIRGTRVGFYVKQELDNVISDIKLLEGKVEGLSLVNNELNKTIITSNTCLTITTPKSSVTTAEDLFNKLDTLTINEVSNDEFRERVNASFRELTSEEIDSIVDTINEFERKEEDLLNGTIKFTNKPDSVQYGIDPKDLITTDKVYEGIKYLYSLTLNGEYNLEFDELNPFELGDIYCKAFSGDAYRSDPFKIQITSRNMSLEILANQNSNYGTATMAFSLDKYDELFTKEFAKELGEANNGSKYKYYIQIQATDHELNETLIIDYDHKNVMMPFVYTSINEFVLTVTYNLPDFYDVDADSSFTFNLEEKTDLDGLMVCCNKDTTNTVQIICKDYFVGLGNTEDKIKVQLIDRDIQGNPSYLEIETTESNGIISFTVDNDDAEIAVTSFEYDGTDKTKGYKEYELDFTHSVTDEGTNITDYGNSLITYNNDNTMNAYFDASFTSISSSVKYFAYVSATSFDDNIMTIGDGYNACFTMGSNQTYLIFEDMLKGAYYFNMVYAVVEYNDIYYVVRRSGGSSIEINPITLNGSLASLVTDEPNSTTTVSSNRSCFDTTQDIILNNYDNTASYKVSSEYINDNGFNDFVINDVISYLYMDATIYTTFELNGFDGVTGYEYLTDDIFYSVKSQFKSKFDIDIKGSNKLNLSRYMIQEA